MYDGNSIIIPDQDKSILTELVFQQPDDHCRCCLVCSVYSSSLSCSYRVHFVDHTCFEMLVPAHLAHISLFHALVILVHSCNS